MTEGQTVGMVETPASEPNLGAEWQRQSQRYIELGFHTELDMTEEEYRASLPKFEPQPETFKGRFDIPVLVETRIKPKRQAELAGISYHLEYDISDWESDPKGYKTPEIPYATWMQDGKKNVGKRVKNVRSTLETDERGATEYDGIALLIANPDILRDHFIDLPGTQVSSNWAPILGWWRHFGGVSIKYNHIDPPSAEGVGSATCGRVA